MPEPRAVRFARWKERWRGSRPVADPFDATLLGRLDRYRFRSRGVLSGRAGETVVRGFHQSTGVEIESFHEYVPGDDIRHVDWVALGRLDQLVTRRFVAERELPVHVLLDASGSMEHPDADGKFPFAIRLAVALAWIAMRHRDAVRLGILQLAQERESPEREPLTVSSVFRHPGRFPELRRILSGITPSGRTALANGVARYLERRSPGGLVFLISDFLVPEAETERALGGLRERGFAVVAVHVSGPTESTSASLRGRLRVRDAETGDLRHVRVGETIRRRLREVWQERARRLESLCRRHGVGYALRADERDVERFLAETLAPLGVLRLG